MLNAVQSEYGCHEPLYGIDAGPGLFPFLIYPVAAAEAAIGLWYCSYPVSEQKNPSM